MRMRLLTVLVPITLVIAAAFLVPFTVDIDARRDQITTQISRDMNIDITAHYASKLALEKIQKVGGKISIVKR